MFRWNLVKNRVEVYGVTYVKNLIPTEMDAPS